MDTKSLLYVFTIGFCFLGFVLCIPYPKLIDALPAFGATVGGLYVAYCGSHMGEGWLTQKVSTLQANLSTPPTQGERFVDTDDH
jgi:hypothetical protein